MGEMIKIGENGEISTMYLVNMTHEIKYSPSTSNETYAKYSLKVNSTLFQFPWDPGEILSAAFRGKALETDNKASTTTEKVPHSAFRNGAFA